MTGFIESGRTLTADHEVSCDVCIVGSGAGGAVLAAGLAEAGLSVVMLEEGGHYTKADFDLQEAHAFPMLYQDRGTRGTSDQAITILQGRSVGGSTTVNWTTCWRTPERILKHWNEVHRIEGFGMDTMLPHFQAVEERLSIAPWHEELVNPNNNVLLQGCRKLGWEHSILRRNVKGCANSGYCGMGCPVDGKQAMHLTYIPDAVAAGAQVWADVKVDRLQIEGDRVVAVHGYVLDELRGRPTGRTVTVKPKVCVSSGGAINGPAMLLRSGLNPNGRVGKRTFLHPVVALPGIYEERIDPWFGAPQSVSSHEFIDRGPDKVGFFLEVSPIHPMLGAGAVNGFGAAQQEYMSQLAHVSALISITVDGLLPHDEGGSIRVFPDGRLKVDYPVGPHLAEAFAASTVALAKLHLAVGAKHVETSHTTAIAVSSEADLAAVASAPYGAHEHNIFSAHQMGGCCMGVDKDTSVVDTQLRHHHVPNLFVVDGSVLPTALGVNPSETIYAIAHRARGWVGGAA